MPFDVRQCFDPLLDGPLHDRVLDDVAEDRLADLGAVEVHLAGAFPHVHLAHRTDPIRRQHRPRAEDAQDALGRHGERADPRPVRRPRGRGRRARSLDDRDPQAHLPQCEGQRRADEPAPRDDHVVPHGRRPSASLSALPAKGQRRADESASGDDEVVPHGRSPSASFGTFPASPIARRASARFKGGARSRTTSAGARNGATGENR